MDEQVRKNYVAFGCVAPPEDIIKGLQAQIKELEDAHAKEKADYWLTVTGIEFILNEEGKKNMPKIIGFLLDLIKNNDPKLWHWVQFQCLPDPIKEKLEKEKKGGIIQPDKNIILAK